MLTSRQVSVLKTLFFGNVHDFGGLIIWETIDNGSDIGVCFSSSFELRFRGGRLIIQGSVVVLREFPLPRLIAVFGSVSRLLAVEAFSFLHEFLTFW